MFGKLRSVFVLFFALVVLAAACGDTGGGDGPVGDDPPDTTEPTTGDGDPPGDGDGDGDQDPGGDDPDDVAWRLSDCRAQSLADFHEDSPRIATDLIVFAHEPGVDPLSVAEVAGTLEMFGLDEPIQPATLLGNAQRYDLGDFRDNDELPGLQEPFWQALNERLTLFQLPTNDIDQLENALENLSGVVPPGLDVGPVHLTGFLGHWGAFTGTDPQICDRNGEPAAPEGEPINVGVIDTGFLPDNGIAEAGPGDWSIQNTDHSVDNGVCPVSHGEFVGSVVKAVNPAARVYTANAFPLSGRCWESDEFQVAWAAARLAALAPAIEGIEVFNFSVGAEPHTALSTGTTYAPVILPIVIDLLFESGVAGGDQVYAAAGNAPGLTSLQPADLDGVIAVAAADEDGEPVVWVRNELGDVEGVVNEPPPWTQLLAPGCNIVAVGTDLTANANEVVVWSGSSFAAPIAAVTLAGGNVEPDAFENVLYQRGLVEPSQCE